MATKGKEPQLAREKRGTSPSNRKSSSFSKPDSPNRKHDSTTATTEKNIPNYLKPTVSSRDPSKHLVKKASPSDSLHKTTNIARRRSLDKTTSPPVSHVQKTRISPNPAGETTARSSPVASKTATSHKPVSDRMSKAPKDAVKDYSLHPRRVGVKKNSIGEKKQGTEASATSRKAPEASPTGKVDPHAPDVPSDHVPDVPQVEMQESISSSVAESVETKLNVGENNATPDEISAPEEDKLHVINPEESEIKSDEEVHDLEIVHSSLVAGGENITTVDKIEEPEDKEQVEEKAGNDIQIEEHQDKGKDSNHPEETVEEEPTIEAEKIETGGATKDPIGANLEEKGVATSGSEANISNQKGSAENVVKEEKPENVKVATKPQVVQGKKDAALVSNDVIEETASKLREQKKNKVKALAGAFETVISLQEK